MAAKKEEEHLTEVQKLAEEDMEDAKKYKAPVDAERVSKLVKAVDGLAGFPRLSHIMGSLSRELRALELKQEETDAEETEEHSKKLLEAQAKDAKAAKEAAEKEAKESPPPAPPIQPRDTRSKAG